MRIVRNTMFIMVWGAFAAGCQSYPKNAPEADFTRRVAVNASVPAELQPFYGYKVDVKKVRQSARTSAPDRVYVLAKNESLDAVKARFESGSEPVGEQK